MNKVMVVEDSPDLRAVMRMALRSEGYDVLLAANGKEAHDLLSESHRPSLILLDLMMPVMSGWEFLTRFRANPALAKIPVVICSAIKDETLGDLPYLKKPVELSDLISVVQKYCGK